MAKPSESRRWAPGLPRTCYSALGLPKKRYETAAQASAHAGARRYPYKCFDEDGNWHWHVATYRGGR